MAGEPELDDVAGVWATRFRTVVTPAELVIDFIREDPFGDRAVVVARVACAHALLGTASGRTSGGAAPSDVEELTAGGRMRQHKNPDAWRNRRLSPEKQAQYDRRMEEIKAEERRKHPELTEFARRLLERHAPRGDS